MYHILWLQNSCNTAYSRNVVCFRYIIANTLHESDDKDENNKVLKFMLNKQDFGTATGIMYFRVGTDQLGSSGEGSDPYKEYATSNLAQ